MSPRGRSESGLGRVVVATDAEAVAEAVRARRLRGGDDAQRPPVRLRPHLRGAAGARSRRARSRSSSMSRATCRPSTRQRSAPCSAPLEGRCRRHRHARRRDRARRGKDQSQRGQDRRLAAVADAAARALFHPRHRALGRGAALSPHRALRLSPRRAGALRVAAALAAGKARAAGAVARAGSRHAHRRRDRAVGAARRRHAGRSRAGARHSCHNDKGRPCHPKRPTGFPSRASPAPIPTPPAATCFPAWSRCPARPSRTPSTRSRPARPTSP